MKSEFLYDSCSLIYLTKIGVKEFLIQLGTNYVSNFVKNELLRDLEKHDDAKKIKTNITEKKIIELKGMKKQIENINLGKGEISVIDICLNNNYIPVIDDKKALKFSFVNGLKPLTSEIILLKLLSRKIISLNDFIIYFDKLTHLKSLKPDVVEYFKELAQEISKSKKNQEEKK